jgi:hypothetical protein
VYGHTFTLQCLHGVQAGADDTAEQLHPTCVKRVDKFGMLRKACRKGFKVAPNGPPASSTR